MNRKKRSQPKVKILEQAEKKVAAAKNDVSSSDNLIEQLKTAAEGLFYISETDAEIAPFVGTVSKSADREEVLKQTNCPPDSTIEQKDFDGFFSRLTEVQDWFGDEEKETVQKFIRLKEILENNLRELKVFKIGKVQLDVYVVGLDENDRLLGVKTKAVET